MKNLLFCLASAFLSFSCSEPKTDGVADRITIDWEAPAPKWNVQKIVPLETNDEALLDKFFRVHVTDRNIFIEDVTRVLVFDSESKYLSKIDRVGHGPQEYIRIMNFWISNDQVYIADMNVHKILVYSLSGEFIRSIPIGDIPVEAVAVSDRFIALKCAYNENGTLIVLDPEGKKLYEAVSPLLAKTTISIPAIFPFTEMGGQLYYFPDFSSSIYTVGADTSALRKTTFDFGVHTLTPELVATLDANYLDILAEHEVVNFPSFFPTRRWWGLTFSLKGNKYSWFYDTETRKQYISGTKPLKGFKPIACATEECFVASVEASAFLEDERFAPYCEGIAVGEEDNAVLIFYTVE